MSALVLAAAAAALGVALFLPPRPVLPRRPTARRTSPVTPTTAAFGIGTLVALVAVLPAIQIAVLIVAAGSGMGVSRMLGRARVAKAAASTRGGVVEACEAVLGELRAGQPPARALEAAAEAWPGMVPVVRSARLGGDVPGALRELARTPGAGELARVAGVWQLSAQTGAGLTYAVGRALETARARQATDRLVQAELASARATARLVVALPVVVLAASGGLGVDPWAFLFGTWPGVGCLAAGAALCVLGLEWIERIAARAAGGVS